MATDSIPAQLAAACQAIQAAGPADAVAGVQPTFVAAPASTGEAGAVLRAAAALNLAVVPRGTGTRLHWGTPPARCDLVVEMTRMDRVIEHAAGDLVATVQSGVSLERLAAVLGEAGQRLALDPPVPGSAISRGTIGGVLAAGAAGPLRLRYGTPRDLLIGITVVRADGTVARSGGKVVKNVAGYDLGKLFAGSRGTLGLITEATFRLHPVPAATAYVAVECAAAADACHLLSAAMDSPLVPVAAEVDWRSADSPVLLAFALEGEATATAERSAAMADLLSRADQRADPVVSQTPPAWWGTGPVAQSGGTVLQIAFWPGDLGLVLADLRAAAAAAGLDPAVGGSAAAGLLHVAVPPEAGPDSVTAFVTGLRSALGHVSPVSGDHHHLAGLPPRAGLQPGAELPHRPARDGHPPARASAVVLHAPAAVSARLDLFGPVPSPGLMRAVKDQFDPDRRMAPGRFAGGI